MCSAAAAPKNWAVSGAVPKPLVDFRTAIWRSMVLTAGLPEPAMASLVICSKPTASATSTSPACTHSRASINAVDPVAQLLLTFTIGIPVSPTS